MSPLNLDPKKAAPTQWRSLDELAMSPEFQAGLEREFPEGASEATELDRRQFLQVMGASFALAGLTGCDVVRRPKHEILPYNNAPEHLIPGKPQFYATTVTVGEEVMGVLVESHQGRPTKIEGNPQHPSSQGATGKLQQASILDLYSPNRSQKVLKNGASSTWDAFWGGMAPVIDGFRANGGEGLRILSGYIVSPSFAAIKQHILREFPKAKWVVYEPVNRDNARIGLLGAVGKPVDAHYRIESAKRILSVDSDFLESELNHVAHARAFAKTRNPDLGKAGMSRLYLMEARYSVTGGVADHRIRVKPSMIPAALALVARELANQGLTFQSGETQLIDSALSASNGTIAEFSPQLISELAADLAAHRGASLILVGKHQPPLVHALGHAVNRLLGNVGTTVLYKISPTFAFNQDSPASAVAIRDLAADMEKGVVDTLLMIDANPVFTAPADIQFTSHLSKVRHSVHLGGEVNESAQAALWHIPQSHYLEHWDDAISFDGTTSIAQPLISPLYTTFSKSEVLAKLFDYRYRESLDIVKGHWMSRSGALGFEIAWRRWLHDGIIETGALPDSGPGSSSGMDAFLKAHSSSDEGSREGGIELMLFEHPNVHDGRFASNSWLQELPEPITKLCWDNAAYIGPSLAQKLGIKDQIILKNDKGVPMGQYDKPMIKVTRGGHSLSLPAWILPGMADETVVIHLGYGRKKGPGIAEGAGFDAYPLLDKRVGQPLSVQVEVTGSTYTLACTQDHWSMESRPIVREGDLELYERRPNFSADEFMNPHPPLASLWEEHDYSKGMQWGMTIDLNSCNGCSVCVVACQAENNIPVVGKGQVIRGREMHWIRLDRYFTGDVDDPGLVFQAMLCQHCENAPCEAVCPVSATVHSKEGLNEMVYNRCIGTRYCSNNCPYKVRRFNFSNLTNHYSESEKMQKNPDVTVRFRGVMEKCTYCVQRIEQARIGFKNKGNEVIPDGAIVPACAQACPTDAIVFGNINDPKSRVAVLKAHPRNYGVLTELNTKPRTTYLAKVRNPNPAILKLSRSAT